MSVRVSVVVAVFNTGEFLEPLIASLLGQTLPVGEWEAVFVDDGSTDGTPDRLDQLAAKHENITVLHEPNSGWPGRPRNLGTDRAQGTYVFYADHDDWFTPEALARMVAYADACGSDVLVPRYAGHRRGVAKALFASGNGASVTPADAPLMHSLTPHKLFRRAFLRETGLRFPEGRRRLEDHVFLVEAYFRAGCISVLADYCCYVHIGRTDAGNAAYQRIDPASYYRYNGEVIDLIYAHTDAGPLRDSWLRRPLGTEILGRLDGAAFLHHDDEFKRSLFTSARASTLTTIPPEVDRGLSPPQQVRATLLRAGLLGELVRYVEHQVGIRARAELIGLRWDGEGELVLDVDARLVDHAGATPVTYVQRAERTLLTVPEELADVVPIEARDCTATVQQGTVTVLMRRREDSEEWPVPTETRREIEERDGALSVCYRGHARLDPLSLGGGRMLTPGIWDLYVNIEQTGWTKETRLGSVRAPVVDAQRRPALLGDIAVVPYWTETYDNLSIYVQATPAALGRHLSTSCRVVEQPGGAQLRLDLALATYRPQPSTARLQLHPIIASVDGIDMPDLPMQRIDDGACVVTAPIGSQRAGIWNLGLGLVGPPHPTGHALDVQDDGQVQVIPTAEAASRSKAAQEARAVRSPAPRARTTFARRLTRLVIRRR